MNPTNRANFNHSSQTGETGETGAILLSNAEFIKAVFPSVPEHACVVVSAKTEDPSVGGWLPANAAEIAEHLSGENNNYVGCSSFYPLDDGKLAARKSTFAACHFLMLDDLGTKVPLERLNGFELSWLIETSPGNFQGGIIFSEPITDSALANQLLDALIRAELCDAGAKNPCTRWARLPVAINGKPKYLQQDGSSFRCKLTEWDPAKQYTPTELIESLNLELTPPDPVLIGSAHTPHLLNAPFDADDVLILQGSENPVIAALKSKGLYKAQLDALKHDITCPWVHEHTDQKDSGTAYFEPTEEFPQGGFCCQHSHREAYKLKNLLDHLGIHKSIARNKPIIRLTPGNLNLIIDAAERVITTTGQHYQSGGAIASIEHDPITGDPSISLTSKEALTLTLANAATWERQGQKADEWKRCDPPIRHINILHDAQKFKHLPVLAGVVRQPYFRQPYGELVTEAGYDETSKLYAHFDSGEFPIRDLTIDEAREQLALLESLLSEFHFVSAADKAAAISAIFTAVVRVSLPLAPAFHIQAPVPGSGKSYLCELIGAFAGRSGNAKVSYPTSSEEATKVILSLLLTNPAVIEFDDMDTDWTPHGTIKRMLTAEHITDRILGASKTATVSTRTLFLGSGNNVGPVKDLLRRVLTIHIDPRSAAPATMQYTASPVDEIRKNRGLYVSAVLGIIQAWIKAGRPQTEIANIVTFNGLWSDYCRQPLLWLGLSDPATSLLNQVRHDPESDELGQLLITWYSMFGSMPTTVRKLLDATRLNPDLLDILREFPIEDRGEVNRRKLGHFLKKNANRIVGGYELKKASADGRTAWCVCEA
jgi:hypothetical protein